MDGEESYIMAFLLKVKSLEFFYEKYKHTKNI